MTSRSGHRNSATPLLLFTLVITVLCILRFPSMVNGDGGVFSGIKNRLHRKSSNQHEVGGSNGNNNNHNAVQMESSTGTIPVDDDSDNVNKGAQTDTGNTCDDILVLNLAKANERAQRAEQQRDVALDNESTALDRITALEEEVAQLQSKLAEERQNHEQFVEESKLALTTVEAMSERKLSEQKQEASEALLAQTMKLTSAMDELKQEKDDVIASLQSKLEMESEELQRKLQDEVGQAQKDRDQQLAEMKRQMEDAVAAAESDRDTKVAELTAAMTKAAQEAEEALIVHLEKTKKGYENVVQEKDEIIKRAQEYANQMLKEKEGKEQSLSDAESELMHWRELHSSRSYCNMTMIQDDVNDATTKLYETSKEKATEGLELAKDAWSKLQTHAIHYYNEGLHHSVVGFQSFREHATIGFQLALEHATVGMQSARNLYDNQMEQTWPKFQPVYEEHVVQNYKRHIEPHVKKHLQPPFEKTVTWYEKEAVPVISKLYGDVSKHCSIAYNHASKWYGTNCNAALQTYRESMRDMEMLQKTPDSVLIAWKDSCMQPDKSIEGALKGFGIIMAVIFWRRVFNLLWWTVSFAISVILTVTPLGFIIPRRRRRPLHHYNKDGKIVVEGGRNEKMKPDPIKSGQEENGGAATMMSPLQTRAQRKEAGRSAVKVKKESAQ